MAIRPHYSDSATPFGIFVLFGFGQGDSAIPFGLGQSDPAAILVGLGQGDSASLFGFGQSDLAAILFGLGHGDPAILFGFGQVVSVSLFGFGHDDSAILSEFGHDDSTTPFGRFSHCSDSAMVIRPPHSDDLATVRIRP